MARHREGDANQQYDRHFEEQRQRADAVSYTHLDVYKRQIQNHFDTGGV